MKDKKFLLKEVLDSQAVLDLAAALQTAHPGFDAETFSQRSCSGLNSMELTERAAHIAGALHAHLPPEFPEAAEVLIRTLGAELPGGEDNGYRPLRYLPHVMFVSKYGLDHFDESMRLQLELTKRFSAEFSIRAFIEKYPERTYAKLVQWTRSPNLHVRRLVSEGTRPRLPWAPRLRAYQEDPTPVIGLLDRLKDDTERYVQRSVANSLNDIAKDHPDVAVEVCGRWSRGAGPSVRWIVKHALRTLIKQGHRGALGILGFDEEPQIRVYAATFSPARVRLGETMRFSFSIESRSPREQSLLVDYAVHFVKKNGTSAPRVFKLRHVTLGAKEEIELSAGISFRAMTTRSHHPGVHTVDARINGVAYELGSFRVLA